MAVPVAEELIALRAQFLDRRELFARVEREMLGAVVSVREVKHFFDGLFLPVDGSAEQSTILNRRDAARMADHREVIFEFQMNDDLKHPLFVLCRIERFQQPLPQGEGDRVSGGAGPLYVITIRTP